jgi:formylglycine-generating enzyme required for sulfatase activity
MVEAPAPPPRTTAVFRRRETGTYGEAPYVDEWKPLPPRLHDQVEVPHATVAARHFAIGRREVTNGELGRSGDPEAPATDVDLAEARAYASSVGARLPTEDEWQLAAEAGLLERARPLVWNWTESEHSDGRTRFAILKGGSDYVAEGSDWYVEGGPHPPEHSLKLLLLGGGLARSSSIGFRLAVDLP